MRQITYQSPSLTLWLELSCTETKPFEKYHGTMMEVGVDCVSGTLHVVAPAITQGLGEKHLGYCVLVWQLSPWKGKLATE